MSERTMLTGRASPLRIVKERGAFEFGGSITRKHIDHIEYLAQTAINDRSARAEYNHLAAFAGIVELVACLREQLDGES